MRVQIDKTFNIDQVSEASNRSKDEMHPQSLSVASTRFRTGVRTLGVRGIEKAVCLDGGAMEIVPLISTSTTKAKRDCCLRYYEAVQQSLLELWEPYGLRIEPENRTIYSQNR